MKPKGCYQVIADRLNGLTGHAQFPFGVRGYGQGAGISRLGKLVQVIGEPGTPQLTQHLGQDLIVLNRPPFSFTGSRGRIEQPGKGLIDWMSSRLFMATPMASGELRLSCTFQFSKVSKRRLEDPSSKCATFSFAISSLPDSSRCLVNHGSCL